MDIIKYDVTEAHIAAIREQCAELTCDTPKGYDAVRRAIAECRTKRTSIEAKRKELKAFALDYGRKVDATAKHLTGLIESIEEPLKAKKAVVDEAKERAKAEAEQRKREELEAQLRAAREAEEARLAAIAEAQRIEAEKLAAERAALEAARAAEEARIRAAREAHEAELRAAREAEAKRQAADRAAIEAERQRLAQEEAIRQAAIRAEREAKERAEQERVAAEQAAIRAAEHKARLEALMPDAEKLAAFAGVLRGLQLPDVTSDEARVALKNAFASVQRAANDLEAFGRMWRVVA